MTVTPGTRTQDTDTPGTGTHDTGTHDTGTHDTGTILARTAKGTGWVVGWRMITRTLGLLSTLVLVRLLTPADFGLIALGTGFACSVEAFTSAGLEDALLREPVLDRAILNTGFTLAVLRGGLTGLLIAALAAPAAGFFRDDRLAWIILALAGATVIDGFENIAIVEFRRNFQFDKEIFLWIVPRLASIVLTIGVAAAWHSHWALIAGILSQRVLRVAVSYRMHPFRPAPDLSAWRTLIGYSLWNWALSVVQQVRERSDGIFIGRLLGPANVGVFAVAFELGVLPMTELIEPLCRTSFSGFAACRRSGASPGPIYLRIIAVMAMLTVPAGVGISLVADPLIRLMFGPSWADAAPVVQMVSLAYCFGVLGSISWVLFQVYGLMPLTARILTGAVMLRLALLALLTPRLGLAGAAMAVTASVITEQLWFIIMTVRRFAVPPLALLGCLWRCLAATACMAAALAGSGLGWPATAATTRADPAMELLLAVPAGAAIYTLMLLALWLATGRPAGAEADVLAALVRLRNRLTGRHRLQPG